VDWRRLFALAVFLFREPEFALDGLFELVVGGRASHRNAIDEKRRRSCNADVYRFLIIRLDVLTLLRGVDARPELRHV